MEASAQKQQYKLKTPIDRIMEKWEGRPEIGFWGILKEIMEENKKINTGARSDLIIKIKDSTPPCIH